MEGKINTQWFVYGNYCIEGRGSEEKPDQVQGGRMRLQMVMVE